MERRAASQRREMHEVGVYTVIAARVVLAVALLNLCFLLTELAINVFGTMLPLS